MHPNQAQKPRTCLTRKPPGTDDKNEHESSNEMVHGTIATVIKSDVCATIEIHITVESVAISGETSFRNKSIHGSISELKNLWTIHNGSMKKYAVHHYDTLSLHFIPQ